jgi:hypothetical protein
MEKASYRRSADRASLYVRRNKHKNERFSCFRLVYTRLRNVASLSLHKEQNMNSTSW